MIRRILSQYVYEGEQMFTNGRSLIALMDFALLDNGTVRYRYLDYESMKTLSDTLDVKKFGDKFRIDMRELTNSV